MRWTMAALVVGVFGAGAGFSQTASAPATAATQATQPAQQRVVRMTVQPAGEPVPALKYRLLPPLEDQIHGDAMTLYYLAMERVKAAKEAHKDFEDQADKWLEMPLADLPKDEARAMLKEFDPIMALLDLATRQTSCQWNLAVEQLGFAAELPGLSLWRYMARFTALQARLASAEGRFDDAFHSLQVGLGMAEQVAGGPTLIQTLVGIAIAQMQTRQLEDLIAAERGPNLYWAIATLPTPFCDLNSGMYYEKSCLYFSVPELRQAKMEKLSPQQWEAMPELIARRLGPVFTGKVVQVPDIAKGIVPKTVLPAAREYWNGRGLSDKQIDAMPVNEANIVFSLAAYERLGQDGTKWFHLPYWQAQPQLERSEGHYDKAFGTGHAGLFGYFAPNLRKIYIHQALLQQHLAALQVIEAIRIHAATHEGRLPATLAEMTDPPAPANPVTGQPFKYQVKGNRFVLDSPAPEGFDVSRGVRYEITVTAK